MAEKTLGDGSLLRVESVLATQAIVLQARLMKIVGAAVDRLPVIMSGRGDVDPAKKTASDAAALAALADIVNKADPVEVAAIIAEVIGYCSIKPKGQTGWQKADLDGHFSDRKADIFPTVIFALREIFGDFFSAFPATGILDRAMASVN